MVREDAAFGWVCAAFGIFIFAFGLWENRNRAMTEPDADPGEPGLSVRSLAEPRVFRQCPMADAEAEALRGRLRQDSFDDLEVTGVRAHSIRVPICFELYLGRVDGGPDSLARALNRFRKEMLLAQRRRLGVGPDNGVMIGGEQFTMMPIEEEFDEHMTLLKPLDLPPGEILAGFRDVAGQVLGDEMPVWFREPLEQGEFSDGLAFAMSRGEPCDGILRFPTGFLYCFYTEM